MNWKGSVAVTVVGGLAVCGVLLWQLPFPSSLLVLGLVFTVGTLVNRTERLDRWREAEEKAEKALRYPRKSGDAAH